MTTTAIVLIASLTFFLLGAALGTLAARPRPATTRRAPEPALPRPEAPPPAPEIEAPSDAHDASPPPEVQRDAQRSIERARSEAEAATRRADELAAALAETRARGASMIEALHRAEETARVAERERESYAAEARLLRQERDRALKQAQPPPELAAANGKTSPTRAPSGGTWWCQECQRGGTSRERCAHAR
jgi:hypothetical protein